MPPILDGIFDEIGDQHDERLVRLMACSLSEDRFGFDAAAFDR